MTFRLGACSTAAAWLLIGCPEPPPIRATSTTSGKTVTLFPVTTTEADLDSSMGRSTGSSEGALDTESGVPSRGAEAPDASSSGSMESTSEGAGSACNAPSPPCSPGMTVSRMQGCGNCGTQAASRSCAETCEWEAWTPSEACTGEGECHPGATMNKTVSCACGGSKIQTAVCTDACSFDAYSDSTACDFRCCTRVVYCNTMAASDPEVRSMYPGRGTWCSQTSSTCSAEESVEGCLQRADDVCEDGVVSTLHVDFL